MDRPDKQLFQRLTDHHHTGSVRERRLGSRDGGRLGWRRVAHSLPLGFGCCLFVLNTMREAKLEDLLSQLIHNLILENQAQHESHRELQAGQFVPRAYMSHNLLSCFYKKKWRTTFCKNSAQKIQYCHLLTAMDHNTDIVLAPCFLTEYLVPNVGRCADGETQTQDHAGGL